MIKVGNLVKLLNFEFDVFGEIQKINDDSTYNIVIKKVNNDKFNFLINEKLVISHVYVEEA